MTDRISGTNRFAQGLRWLMRRNRTTMTIGSGLFLLAVVFGSLPPHSAILAVLFGLAAPTVLTVAVVGRSRVEWLPVVVLVVGCWSGVLTSVWVGQAVVQLAGHDESCGYVNATEQQSEDTNGITTTSTHWVVDCRDGRHTFGTTQYAEVVNADGTVTVRTAGPLFDVLPAGRPTTTRCGSWRYPASPSRPTR